MGFSASYSGSCLCGAVSYEVNAFEDHMGHCHCKMCQKFHGAAFSTFGEVKLENIRWLSGFDNLTHFVAPNGTTRKFCKTCGSSMVFISKYNKQANTIELAISTLDHGENLQPDAHIYTNYKATWLALEDSLPKHEEYRNESCE